MISIIIPTYNRSHLLGATLDSILAQSNRHWECIVVDDGSTDYTEELMEFYCERDVRINFYRRPQERLKGANACRNYGFEKSAGKYVQWFDSDDLMVPDFLEQKEKAIEENDVDFVISKTANFKDPHPENVINRNESYYQFHEVEITSYNYIIQRINWLTPDFLGKREFLKKVTFNEFLASAQERNFFSKLTCLSTKVIVIDRFLTLRRIHESSTQSRLREDPVQWSNENISFLFETWTEISNIKPGTDEEFFFLVRILELDKRRLIINRYSRKVLKILRKKRRYKKMFFYLLYKYCFYFTGRGLWLRQRLMKCI